MAGSSSCRNPVLIHNDELAGKACIGKNELIRADFTKGNSIATSIFAAYKAFILVFALAPAPDPLSR